MTSANLKQLNYLDHYFGEDRSDAELTPSSDAGDFGWEELALGAGEELGWDVADIDVEDETVVDDFGSELEDEGPSSEQQRLISALDSIDDRIQEKMASAQDALSTLQMGTGASGQRQKDFHGYEHILDDLDRELALYDAKVSKLEKTGADADSWIDRPVTQEDRSEIAEMKSTADQFDDYLAAQTKYDSGIADEKTENESMKNQLLDALQYLSGGKGQLFFTAKVGSDGKHIFKYHDDVSDFGRTLISDMADAFATQDWTSVNAELEALPGDAADNTLALVGHVLMEFCPEIMQRIPSDVLETFHASILRGNSPNDSNIYYINQDGKYDKPHNNRRRKDMHHVGESYRSIAEALLAQARQNERLEQTAASQSAPLDPFSAEFDIPSESSEDSSTPNSGENMLN